VKIIEALNSISCYRKYTFSHWLVFHKKTFVSCVDRADMRQRGSRTRVKKFIPGTIRVHISSWLFFLAGLTAMLIALLTVGFQSVKAAIANPRKKSGS
jgi:hypothetical protein